jgi:hypothetical protein
MTTDSGLYSGDLVRVRSKEEILRTLDKKAQLENLPFMPEMFEFCGKQFRVFKRAHKTCDPPNGIGGRRMLNTVHLEGMRCTGDAHGGCQARCLMFWKEAWLIKIDEQTSATSSEPLIEPPSQKRDASGRGCTEEDVIAGTRSSFQDSTEPAFVCQSTQIAQATTPLHPWDLRQYVEDYRSRNVKLSQLLAAFWFTLYSQLASAGIGFGGLLRWLYDTVQKLRGGTPYPVRVGKIPRGQKTPAASLNLQPGELVRVRSYEDILATLNEDSHNRGMYFDPEMVIFCGGTYRVIDRIKKLINEKTGVMQHLKSDCIILDEVVCLACYAKNRRFCPRSIYPYWREIWLERLSQASNIPKSGEDPLRQVVDNSSVG